MMRVIASLVGPGIEAIFREIISPSACFTLRQGPIIFRTGLCAGCTAWSQVYKNQELQIKPSAGYCAANHLRYFHCSVSPQDRQQQLTCKQLVEQLFNSDHLPNHGKEQMQILRYKRFGRKITFSGYRIHPARYSKNAFYRKMRPEDRTKSVCYTDVSTQDPN